VRGSRSGRSSPRATKSGNVKAYRPSTADRICVSDPGAEHPISLALYIANERTPIVTVELLAKAAAHLAAQLAAVVARRL
jgi:hypothetical protein